MTPPADATTRPRLSIDDIRLRPWKPEEAGWYQAALDDEIVHWTRETTAMDLDECAAALEAAGGGSDQQAFAIVETEGGGLLGNLAITKNGSEAELSYWVAAGARGRGAATAALSAGTRMAFQDPAVTSCFLLIHPDNEASIRVAQRAGYHDAGTQPGPSDCSNEAGLVAVYRYPSGGA